MDKVDATILKMLEKNARVPFSRIADVLKISESTVRKRVKKLIKEGYIKRFTIEYGKSANVISLIKVKTDININFVANKIANTKNVRKVYTVTGEYDIIAFISAENPIEINNTINTIRNMKGVEGSLSFFVLKTF